MSRRGWGVALALYGIAIGIDIAVHLSDDRRAGATRIGPAELTVAFEAGLFWPADLAAAALLSIR